MIVINVKMGELKIRMRLSCTKEVRFFVCLNLWVEVHTCCVIRSLLWLPTALEHQTSQPLESPSVVWFLFPTSLMSHHSQQSAHLPAILNSLYVPEVPAMVPHFCVYSVSFLCLQCPYTRRPLWKFYHLLKISSNMRPTNDPGWIRVPPF